MWCAAASSHFFVCPVRFSLENISYDDDCDYERERRPRIHLLLLAAAEMSADHLAIVFTTDAYVSTHAQTAPFVPDNNLI